MRRKGFTFIEMMLVSAIFATLSVAVFTCLFNGIRLWDRARQLMTEEGSLIFFDRFATDMRNSFSYSKIAFEGRETAVAFPSVVWTAADRVSVRASEGMVDQIGRVEYSFDPAEGVVLRRQANYSQALKGLWGGEQAIVSSVKDLSFRYFYAVSSDARSGAEPGDGLPAGIEVDITVSGGAGKEDKMFKRYFALPAGV
jgi:prepilin-type N-terminal cleavage/methylation domain-containing protein